MKNKNKIFFLIFFAIGLIAYSTTIKTVYVKRAIEEEKALKIDFFGRVVFEKVSYISSPVNGIIKKVYCRIGDFVKKSQKLFEVYRDEPGFSKKVISIISPFNGIIKAINGFESTRIGPQKSLITIADIGSPIISANLIEKYSYLINTKNKINVLYDKKIFQGVIVAINGVNTKTNMLNIKIKVKTSVLKGIAEGSEVKLEYEYDKKKIYKVPAEAIYSEAGSYYLWILNDDKTVKRIKVNLGDFDSNYFEVVKGLDKERLIVYYGYEGLKDGDKVEIVESNNEY